MIIKLTLTLWTSLFLLNSCIGIHTFSSVTLETPSSEILQTPKVTSGKPAAGKRVTVTPEEYQGTQVFHTLYLPKSWSPTGKKLPIIFEYTGNYFPRAGSTGEPEGAGLGYGLSGGKFIWVSLPYISQDHKDNQKTWWGDIQATLNYAKKNVPKIIKEFNADPNQVFLCGFSRGAIGVNFLGHHDDEISKLWTAFISHDHFDGVRQWSRPWGAPLKIYREEALVRLRRVGNRPYLVIQNGSVKGIEDYVRSAIPNISNFTFSSVNTAKALGKFPNEFAIHPHNDRWLSKPSADREKTWNWVNQVLQRKLTNVPESTAKEKPNILYILTDDLGFSDLGCFGGEIKTPNLDSLAKGGVRLTQFYNTGRCCPSRAAILTGQYPHRVGLGHMTTNDLGHPGFRGVVSSEVPTIAQALKPAGYRSFMSGKWHLGTPDPTKHGFEEFYGTLVSAKRFFDPDHLIRLPAGRKARTYPKGEFYATDAVTDHAIDFLKLARQTSDKPWFLYLAYHAPHFPLHAPKEEIENYKDRYHDGWDKLREDRLQKMIELGIVPKGTKLSPRSHYRNYGETKIGINPAWESLSEERRWDLARRMAIYAAMIDRLDQQIGRVIKDLKSAGEFENTLIVFTSDNGACFEWDPFGFDIVSSNQNILHRGEMIEKMGQAGTFHSVGSGWANASNTPWRLYKHFNHEGGIASPGIVHWPVGLKIPTGTIHHQPAHIIDLLPTALAVSGASYEGKMRLPGMNLIDQFQKEESAKRILFFEHQGNRAVRDGQWKLVALDDEPWELYDLSVDRIESNNLADLHPDRVKQLSKLWDEWGARNNVTPLPKDLKVKYLKAD